MEHGAGCSQQEVPEGMVPAFSFLCALARGPGSKRLPQVYAMSLGRPIHVHIPAKAKTLTLAISPGGDLPTWNSAITLGTLEEGLLSSAHMSPVSSAYSAVGNLSWDTPTFRAGLREQGLSLVFHPSQMLSGRLLGFSPHQSHFERGSLDSLGLYRVWVLPNGQYPDFPSLMNIAQMKVALGPQSKACL